MNDTTTFTDKRSRSWELFIDLSYYDMTCVRCVSLGRDFDNQMSFHFNTYKQATEFMELLKVSS